MKKLLLLATGIGFACASFAQQHMAAPKLSPYTRMLVKTASGECRTCRILADGQRYLPMLVKVEDAGLAADALRLHHAKVGTKAGMVWTVQYPFSGVSALGSLSGISYVEAGEPAEPQLNQARRTTRADSVQKGYNLPMHYTGSGVMVGVVDFGFDYNHPTFYDTLGQHYRIQKVWELNGTGTPPAGFSYGNEITDTSAIKAQGTDNAVQTHGTATTGIAAGSGFGSTPAADRFRGMAPTSDIVLVGVRRDTIGMQWLQGTFPDFVDAVSYIFQQADAAQKPCVINISWGSQSGPHDGSTLLNSALNALSGPGRLVVMSAGNEGEEKIHLAKTFSAADTSLSTFLNFTGNPAYRRTWVDAWGEVGNSCCAKVTMWSNGAAGNTTTLQCIDDGTHDAVLLGSNGTDSCIVQFITSSAEYNGKPRMTVDVLNKTTDSVSVTFTGNTGTWNLWNEYYFYGFTYGYQCSFADYGMAWATKGDSISTVSDMGAGDSILMVGAYASKTDFTDINGNSWSYAGYVSANRLVPFSSRGPLSNSAVKPDITAPGLTIATAMSSYDTAFTPTGSNSDLTIARWVTPSGADTFYYCEFTGTSASAPCATGIVALLLQVDPTLSMQELKTLLYQTAIVDAFTGTIPAQGNNNWGHGKINAYKAIKQLLQTQSVYQFTGSRKLDCVLFPNPSDGNFLLDYTGDKAAQLRIDVYDITGRLMTTDSWKTQAGANQRSLKLGVLPKGTYVVRVAGTDGAVSIKTVIQ